VKALLRTILLLLAIGMTAALPSVAAQAEGRGRRGDKRDPQERPGREQKAQGRGSSATLPPEVAALRPLSVVLGRPTDRAITLNLLAAEPLEVVVEYGPVPGGCEHRSEPVALQADRPAEVTLGGLTRDTAYAYRLRSRRAGTAESVTGAEFGFHTQRAAGSTFVFEIQGDSHPERPQQFDPGLYAQTLRAAAIDSPDFYLTIGDDFSVDKLGRRATADAVAAIYREQRLYLGLVGRSSPVFLVNGNHEQAARCNLDGTAENVAVWAQTNRSCFFPQPAPDGFYSGDAEPVEYIGLLRDYYAWTWGDALFVVIDPYWHSAQPVDNAYGSREKARDPWGATLGDAQYQWLQRTLAESRATFKFVFAHHVLGTGRGGIERAGMHEWGDTSAEFARNRPGWQLPIHQLMAKHGVTVFFQGHDHLFVRQELDGVVYQTLPEPADPNYTLYNRDAYRSGDALPNSGRVRVTVSPERVGVAYLRSWLPKDATAEHPDNATAFHYEIPARTGTVTPGTMALPHTTEGKAQ